MSRSLVFRPAAETFLTFPGWPAGETRSACATSNRPPLSRRQAMKTMPVGPAATVRSEAGWPADERFRIGPSVPFAAMRRDWILSTEPSERFQRKVAAPFGATARSTVETLPRGGERPHGPKRSLGADPARLRERDGAVVPDPARRDRSVRGDAEQALEGVATGSGE